MQGYGGLYEYKENYIKKVCDLVRKNGGLIIADEVQTGLGRLGEAYWGF